MVNLVIHFSGLQKLYYLDISKMFFMFNIYLINHSFFLGRNYVLFIIFTCRNYLQWLSNRCLQKDIDGEKEVADRNREMDILKLTLGKRERGWPDLRKF